MRILTATPLVVLAGFLAAPSVSQNNNYTLGLLNGRWLNQASEQERLAYLSGFHDHEGYSWALDIPGPLFRGENAKLLSLPPALFTDG